MMPTPQQKLTARQFIQQAQALLQSIEQAAEMDQYQEIPRLLVRLDGVFFDLRHSLPSPLGENQHQDGLNPSAAAIQDEYDE